MDTATITTHTEARRNAPDIATLIDDARRAGIWFPRDPSNPDGVQIRVHRSATADGHRLAATLRERRDEVNHFFKERRPAWPDTPDDGYGPRLNPDEPDTSIFLIQLEAILAEDAIATAIEEAVSHAQERIAGIVAQAVAARRSITTPASNNMQRGVEFRGGKVVRR